MAPGLLALLKLLASFWLLNAEVVNHTSKLFTDRYARVSADGSCGGSTIPGSVKVVGSSDELHSAVGKDWSWLDSSQSCASSCKFNSSFGVGGAYWCQAASAGERLHCDCQQCPCQQGFTGLLCDTCSDDSACSPGFRCSRSPIFTADAVKPLTCGFSDKWKRTTAYRLFFADGWGHPQVAVEWNPSLGVSEVAIIGNMCADKQPLLFKCQCRGCELLYDKQDSVTGEIQGPCAAKSLASPCGQCSNCACSYPDDTLLPSTVKTVIDSISGGVAISCERGEAGSNRCASVLDDLPVVFELDCVTGHCTDKEDGVEGAVSSSDVGWSTVALVVLLLVFCCALLILFVTATDNEWARRQAKTADLNAPGNAMAAFASAQASLQGFVAAPLEGSELSFSWSGVSCVRNGVKVLQSHAGLVQSSPSGAGKLVAVTGPSGCGKTTLLEALAGRVSPDDAGEVFINGQKILAHARQRHIAYVHQDEILGATLTVREALEFSAALRLRALNSLQRSGRVSWALKTLGLEGVSDSMIGDSDHRGISGGERRRVAIGVELVVSPPVMILDEPTTGLDASSALKLGKVLSQLAEGGRILLCSMHQPRAELVSLFDERIELGPEPEDVVLRSDLERAVSDERLPVCDPAPNTVGKVRDNLLRPFSDSSAEVAGDQPSQQRAGQGDKAAMADLIAVAACASAGALPARLPVQVFCLWKRSLQESCRGNRSGLVAAGVVIAIGIFFGLTFGSLDNNVAGVQNRFGSIFFSQLFFSFFGLQVCTQWYVDRERFDRERTSRLYSAEAYFISKALAYLWWYCFVIPALFVAISYPMLGYRADGPAKPLLFFLSIAGTTASASGVSLLCLSTSSSFAPGMSVSAISLTVLLMYSGFLQRKDAIPLALRWLVDISPFAHSFAAMISSELAGLETVIDTSIGDGAASEGGGISIQGDIWLYQFNIHPDNVPVNAQFLGIVSAVLWVLAFVPIWLAWYRLRRPLPLCFPPGRSKTSEARASPCAHTHRASLVKAPGALVWQDLQGTLPNGTELYDRMSGMAHVGRPLAVLGPSGCGKTTLLSCLAGEATRTKFKGTILLNRERIGRRGLRRSVGYVRQDDALLAEVTVREAVAFATALRLPNAAAQEKADRVSWTLSRLGLQDVACSRIGGQKRRGISGGERRRTAIAVELAVARGVLMLDEPTSGLDSTAALALGNVLSELAAEGCIVVATLHQPSPELSAIFDSTLVLGSRGRVAFYGKTASLGAYTSGLCSQLAEPFIGSPTDMMLDLVSGQSAGSDIYSRFSGSPHWKALQEDIQLEFSTNASAAEEVTVLQNPPLMAQLTELFKREMRISIRDRSLALYHYGGALIAGLLLGFTYFQMPLDLSGVISRIGLFFVVQCILGMQALQGLMAWRDCYTSFVRERAAGYYSTGAFVVTKVTVDALLLRVGPPLLLCLAIYSLAGLHPGRAGVSCLGVCLASIASSTFCFALGATAPRSAVVLPLAVLLLLIYLLFGGVLLSGATAVAYISFFRFSYDMLVSNEFRGLNFKFNPEGVSTTLASIPGEEWMRLLGIAGEPLGVQVGWLLGWSLIYVLLTWAILSIHTAGLQNPCGTAPKDRSHDESLQVGATESE